MFPLLLLGLAFASTLVHLVIKKNLDGWVETLLSYLIFFNIGVMGIAAFYAHAFRAEETAQLIGWPAGNPFQSEIAAANLAFGILGIAAFWLRRLFWAATVTGYCIFLLGAFVVHMHQLSQGNLAPYNAGPLVWVGDLFFPILALGLLGVYFFKTSPFGYRD